MTRLWNLFSRGKAVAMKHMAKNEEESAPGSRPIPGLAGWLLGRLRRGSAPGPRLVLRERITLAPRQTLALVEAEGRRFLVATSAEGAPAFFALDERRRGRVAAPAAARVSW